MARIQSEFFIILCVVRKEPCPTPLRPRQATVVDGLVQKNFDIFRNNEKRGNESRQGEDTTRHNNNHGATQFRARGARDEILHLILPGAERIVSSIEQTKGLELCQYGRPHGARHNLVMDGCGAESCMWHYHWQRSSLLSWGRSQRFASHLILSGQY